MEIKELETKIDVRINLTNVIDEYKKIISTLGAEKSPISLAKFQDLKYNNFERYERLKDQAYIQNNFKNGIWLDKINHEKQARHIKSTAGEDKSFFFDDVDVDEIYRKYKQTGRIRTTITGNKTSDEKVDLPNGLRLGIDVFTGNEIHALTIKHSKTGAHIIPTYYDKEAKK